MRSFPKTARVRIIKECWVKKRIKNSKDCMMHYSVSHRCLMDNTAFRVADNKRFIRTMNIIVTFQICMKLKKIVLKISFKINNILFFSFAFSELKPR